MLVLVLGNKISPNDKKKTTHCNNLDLLKELMLKLRSLYLLNIYLIHVVWNHVDKENACILWKCLQNHEGFDITAWVLMKKEYKMNTHFDPSRVYDVPIFAWFILWYFNNMQTLILLWNNIRTIKNDLLMLNFVDCVR